MVIPPGKTEADVLEAIGKAADILAPSFAFGCYDEDDIRQQCFIYAFELLEKGTYDASRPLANYIYTHVRRRLLNFRRDKFRRSDPPCPKCHAGTPCKDAAAGEVCAKYKYWSERNQAKANICNPLALDNVCDERERRTKSPSTAEEDAEIGEMLAIVDRELPVELRQTYLQMRAGVSVPKGKRLQVEQAVKDILRGAIEECPSEND